MTSVIDANNPEQVKKAKDAAGRRRQRDKLVVEALLQHQDGRSWLRRKLEECHIFATSFRQGEPDTTAFVEGERNIGLRLLIEIQAFPDQYVLMIKEGKEDGNA